MKINIYIDGFNLYYGAIKNTPYKWLDLMKMSELLFPNDTINKIKYFSARVSARATDPDQPIRQATYWRALKTIPNLEIIEGTFLTKDIMMPLSNTNRLSSVLLVKSWTSWKPLSTESLKDLPRRRFVKCAVLIG